jgi:hypothetical protein
LVNYIAEFDQELGEIDKLVETPDLMRNHAVSVLNTVLNGNLPNSFKKTVENGILALEHISDASIRSNYEAIYNQCCVLAVSLLGAKIEKYFVNYGNYHWKQIDTSKKGKEIKFSLGELAENGFNLRSNITSLIKAKDNSISFQDLLSTKRTFEDYFHRTIEIPPATQKKLIFYQQCRHNIVHVAGYADTSFVSRVTSQSANIKSYSAGDKIALDAQDWKNIKTTFKHFMEILVNDESEKEK